MINNIQLSVVVLCYRSNESIIRFTAELQNCIKSITPNYEIILVGNYFEGKGDKTKEIVEAIAAKDSKIVTVCKPKEGMMGWDMRSGLEVAKGEIICIIDGDGQFPIESIKEGYDLLILGNYDLVKSFRARREDGFYRRTISIVFNFLFNILFPGLNSKDINSKPKFITKNAYNNLNLSSDDWFIDAEIMIRARKLKLKIKDFPVIFSKLEDRRSFVKFGAVFEFISNLIKYRIKEFSSRG
jgi:glycosyltransferase involved in cell wall biosynthesis